jgi:membrane-associated phospholipid phosphatase
LLQKLDNAVLAWVQAHLARRQLLMYCCRDYTSLGSNVLVFLFTALSLLFTWKVAVAVAPTAVAILALKLLVGRPCPLQPDPCQVVRAPVHLPCMPSGHTMGSTVLYGAVAHELGCCWWVGLLLPVGVGVTRVALSAHWLTDVIVGFALGHLILLAWNSVVV